MSIFSRKPLNELLTEANATGEGSLKKTFGPWGLVALGVGAVIGAGLFSITGMAAGNFAGPSIMISFVVAALGCALAGLCYAEFASMIPVAGSAYTYSYATMGEFIAWVIGWDLVLEYAVGAATVASSWSGYLDALLQNYGYYLPPELLTTPFEGGWFNLPAVFIVVMMSLVLVKGTSESALVNTIIVILKVAIVLVFIFVGLKYVDTQNHTPFIPENTGNFGEFGFSGIIRGAAIVFFAYIGFDAVSTAAQETKNPKKAMPIGILGSLIICTVLYVAFAYVMTGVVDYKEFVSAEAGSHLAPVAIAIQNMGEMGADGLITPAYPWLNNMIIIAILLGYASVILVLLLGQSRVFYSMSKDGLLPKVFSNIHPKFQTPFKANMFFLVFVSLFAAFVPGNVVGEMTSIGTLFAFILVCMGVLIMRKTMPDAPRGFRTPLVPFVPVLGILVCFFMMAFLPLDTWVRLIVWMLIGLDVYFFYGMRHSRKSSTGTFLKDKKILSLITIILSIVLIVVALIHHHDTNGKDMVLYIFSLVFSTLHIIYFIYTYIRDKR
ncbi:amino acid permease [Avrilella dinanensis]|uniref:Amino acid permease n=1 Tax=Avrilella dinanensis TaxID=2008672 RepID=A0A2M9R6K3_9FLAO|nr:amino acid permease [Avrilella dinanensis]PJR04502.1 amino acid permease [Avrilella dinanensis]